MAKQRGRPPTLCVMSSRLSSRNGRLDIFEGGRRPTRGREAKWFEGSGVPVIGHVKMLI